ncbi:MAG: hypothetical protein N2746_04830 [Deltaproteobacteria bacterium]|nr:hypothetical protein [Deltaproteobacteria bacterium]
MDKEDTIQNNLGSEKKDQAIEKKSPKVPIWIWVIILILVIICLYFLSLINSKKYRITSKNDYLIVKKGLFLPYGFSEYIPKDITKREAYSPLKIPKGETVPVIEVDKGELDVTLFKIISKWIEKFLQEESEENVRIASSYIERLMKLNVSPEDFERYSRLKGEVVFKQAKFNFNMGIELIKRAREKMSELKNLNPEFLKEAAELIEKIDKINKAITNDYILLSRQDIDKMKEDIKKECISSCIRDTIEKSTNETLEQSKQDNYKPTQENTSEQKNDQ